MKRGSLADRLETWFSAWISRAENDPARITRTGAAGPLALVHSFTPESSHAPLLDSLAGLPDGRTLLTIHSFECADVQGLGPLPWSAADFDVHGRALGLAGTRWRMMHTENGADIRVFDRQRMEAIHLTAGPVQWWEYGAPMLPFLYWCAASRGAVMVHAGTIGTGSAMGLVGGASGTGKSTTVLLGLNAGLSSCGDDFVYLEPGPDGSVVHLVYRTVKTLPHSTLLPQRAERSDWNGNKDVHWLPVSAVQGGPPGLVARAPLTIAWHLVKPPVLRQATAMDVLARLLPSTVLRVPGDEPHVTATLRRIVAGLAIVELPRDGDFARLLHRLRDTCGAADEEIRHAAS